MPASRPVLDVASTADERFFPGLAVTFASVVNAASGRCDYRLHLLQEGIANERIDALRAALEPVAARRGVSVELRPVPFRPQDLAGLPPHRDSLTTYGKILLPRLLPEVGVVRFVDADMLCCAGVEEMEPEDGGFLMGGIIDAVVKGPEDPLPGHPLTRAEKRQPYFNGGVFWMDLARLREEGRFGEACGLARDHQPERHDQTLINHLWRGRIAVLPDRFNLLLTRHSSGRVARDWPRLNVHYIGPDKPWSAKPGAMNYFAFTLWHHAAQTLVPDLLKDLIQPLPLEIPEDLATIRRKTRLYTVINPQRGLWYRRGLASCLRWQQFLHRPDSPLG